MQLIALALALATTPAPVLVRLAVHQDVDAPLIDVAPGVRVQDPAQTRKHVEDAAALGLSCAPRAHARDERRRFERISPTATQSLSEHDCFVKLALLAGADVLVDVREEARPNGPVIVTRVVDVVRDEVRIRERLERPSAVDVGALLVYDDTAAAAGVLRVDGTPGGEVFLEGRRAGRTPLALTLPAGKHPLAIVREGYVDVVVDADVVAGRVADVKAAQATLPAAPTPPPARTAEEDRWVDAIAVGVGAVALGAAAVATGAFVVHLTATSAAAGGDGANGAAAVRAR